MGLTGRLMSAAARRPHVLLAPVPGHASVRRAAEDALDRLGWARAASPAEADVLLCCGPLGPKLATHVEVAWQAMPGPRIRTTLDTTADVEASLAAAAAGLTDVAAQRQDAVARPVPPRSAADAGGRSEAGMGGMGGMEDAHTQHSDTGHGAMRDEDDAAKMHDGGMDSSMDMDMDLPGGLVMADRVEDRDGLRLEGLRLSWGPLLPAWPAGLRLDVLLSGDVLVEAQVRRLDPRPEPDVKPKVRALDALATLLEAAGWHEGALRARRARAAGGTGRITDELLRRLDRARLLRWSLRQLPAPGGGDLVTHLDRLIAAARGGVEVDGVREDELSAALVGLDIGTAHLVVAAYGPLLVVPVHV